MQGLVVAQSPCYCWVGFLYLSLNPCQATQHISSHKKFAAALVLKHQRRGKGRGSSISSSQGMWFSSSHLIFGQETEMGIGKAAEPT